VEQGECLRIHLYAPMETLLAEQSTADDEMITPSEDLR
jgi:hypothetical protein